MHLFKEQLHCPECKKEYMKRWRTSNKVYVATYQLKYLLENKNLLYRKARIWRRVHREEIAVTNKKYRELHTEKKYAQTVAYKKMRRKLDPLYKMTENLRTRMRLAFRKGWLKSSSTAKMLGLPYPEVKTYLENKWLPGMSWSNYGSAWQIDHIVGLCNASTKEELERLFHYTNLQPLWTKDNLRKIRYQELDGNTEG